jgi:hypothetical protein
MESTIEFMESTVENSKIRSNHMTGNVAGIIRDVVELIELQGRLLVRDSKSVARQSVVPIIVLVAAACMMLGSIPIALLCLAEVLQVQGGLTRTLALLIATGVALALSLLLYTLGRWRLRKSLEQLDSSRQELAHNTAWFKQVLGNPGETRHA